MGYKNERCAHRVIFKFLWIVGALGVSSTIIGIVVSLSIVIIAMGVKVKM